MTNIDPTKIRVGSILKYEGRYWVAIRAEDFGLDDVLAGNIIEAHGWYFRKSDLPCPSSAEPRPAASETERKDQMNWSPFFTCFVEGTNGGTHLQHHNQNMAKAEAERLSSQSQNLDKKVYVMKAVAYCKSTKPEVKWLDTIAFEKIVKASPLDFVRTYTEPQATIASQSE